MAVGNMLSLRPLTFMNNFLKNWTIHQRNFSPDKSTFEKEIPVKPKRPAGAFIEFLKDHRSEVLKNNPGLSAAEVALQLGKKWQALSDAEKVKYREERESKQAQYKIAMIEYEKLLASARSAEGLPDWDGTKINKYKHIKMGIKHLSKAMAKPVSPTNSFKLFCLDNKDIKSLKELRDAWNNLPEEKKNMYEKEFQKKFVEYEAALSKWEEKMLNEGQFDLIRLKTLKKMINKKS